MGCNHLEDHKVPITGSMELGAHSGNGELTYPIQTGKREISLGYVSSQEANGIFPYIFKVDFY